VQAAHRGRFPVHLSVNGKPDDVAAYPDAERAALIDRAYAAEIDLAEVVDLLAAGDRQVAMALAANDAVPSSSLQELVERYPDLRSAVARNPNAPTALKDEVPIGALSGFSLQRYLDERRATPPQRMRLLEVFDAAPPGEGTALGALWSEIVRDS